MANDMEREVVPGLSAADVKEITDTLLERTDGNHPQLCEAENGFLDILQNFKPVVSASPIFVRKI